MSRRIEIELTSQRNDSEWTWRAAGAKQPKGVLAAAVLYEGAKVGDVSKAEADFEIEGITITAVHPPQGKRNGPVKKLEIIGPGTKFEPVTSVLAPKGAKREGRRPPRDGDRPDRPDRSGRPGGAAGRPGERAGRPTTAGRSERPTRREGAATTTGRRPRTERSPRSEGPTFKRLMPKDDHRNAVLDKLPAEQRPIAEQVLRGGIRAVRQAVEAENAKAKGEGRPEINSEAFIAMAEEMLPQLRAAGWMDRAQAAKTQVNEISVRDLRAVVGAADAAARTDESRVLASELRDALDRRSGEERDRWLADITTSLDENRVVRALRLSSRPPDPQVKFPPELLARLKADAEQAMSPDTAPERWVTLLEVVGVSPVRRSVVPVGLPAEPGEELLSAAKQAAGRIPALAKLVGVTMPPPPRRVPRPPAKVETPPVAPAPPPATTLQASDTAPVAEPGPVVDDEPAPPATP